MTAVPQSLSTDVPGTLEWIILGLGVASLLFLILSFVAIPVLGPLAALLGAGSVGMGWWRRKKQGVRHRLNAIGLWLGLPAILVFLATLGLVLFF